MEDIKEKKEKDRKNFQIFGIAIVITIMIVITILAWPYVTKLQNVEYREHFIEKMQSMGFMGAISLVVITALQVLVAFIPGEFVELLAGIMYGPWLGLILCLIGVTIGCTIVYYLVKLLGRGFVDKVVNIEKYENKWKFMNNTKRLEIIIFSLTLIPGLPKDFIAFVIPFTKLKLRRYLIINALGRIPSILSSTYFSSSLLKGNFKMAIIIFGTQTLVAALGIIFNKQIVDKIEKKHP